MPKQKRKYERSPERIRTPQQRERMVRAIWNRLNLENLECRGFCHDSCSAIGYSQAEAKVIESYHDTPPMANGIRTREFKTHQDIECDKLTHDKRCEIYDERPMICRLYGMFRNLRCAHGCEPKEWLDDEVAANLLVELDRLEGPHAPSQELASFFVAAAKRAGVLPNNGGL